MFVSGFSGRKREKSNKKQKKTNPYFFTTDTGTYNHTKGNKKSDENVLEGNDRSNTLNGSYFGVPRCKKAKKKEKRRKEMKELPQKTNTRWI